MRRAWWAVLLAIVLWVGGCGGGDTTSSSVLVPVDEAEAQKLSAREAVRAAFDALPHADVQSDNEQLAAFMRTQSIFSNVQLFPGLITAEWPDGEIYYVMNNVPYVETDDPPQALFRARPAVQPLQSEDAAAQAVGTGKCLLVNAYASNLVNDVAGNQGGAADSLGAILRLLQSKKFNPSGPDFTSYETFRSSFDSVDILVWCGHSAGDASRLLLSLPFTRIPSVDDRTDPDTQGKPSERLILRGDTVVGQINSGRAPNLSLEHLFQLTPSYAVGALWMKKYVHLTERSLCLIDACGSATDPNLIASLNPGTFVGWTGAPEIAVRDSLTSDVAFFDVALSTNSLQLFDSEDPPRNDFQSVLSFLGATSRTNLPEGVASRGRDYGLSTTTIPAAHGRAAIVSKLLVEGNGFLTPWIETAEASAGQLTLEGSFGDDPGEGNRKVVLASGSELTVISWSSDRVVCDAGGVRDGDRVSAVVFGHPGNEKPVQVKSTSGESWTIPMRFLEVTTEGAKGSHQYQYDIELRVHVGDDLEPVRPTSTAFLSVSGTVDNGSSVVTYSTDKTQTLQFTNTFTGKDGECYTIMTVGQDRLNLFMSGGFFSGIIATDSVSGPTKQPALLATPHLFTGMNKPVQILLDSNRNVVAGSQTSMNGAVTSTLSWDAAPLEH